jgi:hypothetical protein
MSKVHIQKEDPEVAEKPFLDMDLFEGNAPYQVKIRLLNY